MIKNIKKYVVLGGLLVFTSVDVQLAGAESPKKWLGLSQEQLIAIAEASAVEAEKFKKAYLEQSAEMDNLRLERDTLSYNIIQASEEDIDASFTKDELIDQAYKDYRNLETTSRATIADLERRLAGLRQDVILNQSEYQAAIRKNAELEAALAAEKSKSDSFAADVVRLEQLLSQQVSQSQTAGSRVLESTVLQEQDSVVSALQARLNEVEQLSQLQAAALQKLEEEKKELKDQNDQLASQLSMQQLPDVSMVGVRVDSPSLQEELADFDYAPTSFHVATSSGLDAATLATLRREVGAIIAPHQQISGASEVDRIAIDLGMEMTKLNAAKEKLEKEKRAKEAQLVHLGNLSGADSSLPKRSAEQSGKQSSALGFAKDLSRDAPEMGLLAGIAAFGKSFYDSRQRTATATKLQQEVAALNAELAQVNTNRVVYEQNQKLMRVLQRILPITN